MSIFDKAARDALPDDQFAVPGKRKLPINDEQHTKSAHTMVDRTHGLTDEERVEAKHRILARAKELSIDVTDWTTRATISFQAVALNVPEVSDHPNKMPFSGVLTRIDQPSDMPPEGSRGKRTVIPKAVAESALPSLLGMAVDYKPGFNGHDPKQKIGLITGANIVGDAVEIEGFFYAKDFPKECAQIKAEKGALGFSYELDARILDLEADPWVIEYCVFTGAAVLYKELAAYRTTSLAAQAEQDIDMTKEEMQELLAAALKPLSDTIESQAKELEAIKAAGASLGGPIINQVKPHVEACMAAADSMDAAGVGSHPTMGHAAMLRKIGKHMAVEAASGKVPHIYNDHSYFDAAPSISAASTEASVAVAAQKIQAAADEKTAALTKIIEDLGTKFTDLQAAGFNSATPPARATLSPEIKSLLAKAQIGEGDVKDGRLSTDQVNAMLDAGNIHGQKAMELKLKLRHNGQMQVGRS